MKFLAKEVRYFFTAVVSGLLLVPLLLWGIDWLLGIPAAGDSGRLLSGYRDFYGALDDVVTWLWVLSPYVLFLLMRRLFSTMRQGGGTAIGRAVATGKVAMVESLVESGVDINAANATGQTPLHLAADKGNAEIDRLLL